MDVCIAAFLADSDGVAEIGSPLLLLRMTTLPIEDVVSFASMVIMEKSCSLDLLDSSVCCAIASCFCSSDLPSMNVGRYAFPIIIVFVPIHIVRVMELYFVLLHVSTGWTVGPKVFMLTKVHICDSISPFALVNLCSKSE